MFDQQTVQRNIRRTLRLMDYISDKYLSSEKPDRRNAGIYYEIYQELATAWHYWGLMCRHRSGYRKIAGGKRTCRICGLLDDAQVTEYLLPARGVKVIGRYRAAPGLGSKVFPGKAKAFLIDDGMTFHGARLRVRVHHAYPSRLIGRDIAVAADRNVELREKGVVVTVDRWHVDVRPPESDRRRGKVFGAFVWELPRKLLKRFPLLISHGPRGQFHGVEIFHPRKQARLRQKHILRIEGLKYK